MKIILCGFMGCGKTSLGKKVAKVSGYSFYDLDNVLEKDYNMKITEMFAKHGEDYFRECETNTLIKLLSMDEVIIGSGGGTVIKKENVDLINKMGGKILFLDVPLAHIQDRLKNDKKRPLLQREDRTEFIEKLYKERYGVYRNASHTTIRANVPIKIVTERILDAIEKLKD